MSCDTGTIPETWKTAVVQPVYKKGSKYDAANYISISLTCIRCKIWDHNIIASHIMNHRGGNNIIYPLQHGKEQKLWNATLRIYGCRFKNLEEGNQTDVLVMDFAKAFDTVCRSLLLQKLHHIQGKTNIWIQAFPCGRSQIFAIEGYMSESVSVQSRNSIHIYGWANSWIRQLRLGLWDPREKVDINKIEMVQRKGTLFVKQRYHSISSVIDLLEEREWKSLETRRKESRLTMMYKIVNQQVVIDPDKHLMKSQKQSRSANTNSCVV